MSVAIITGASRGMGEEFAYKIQKEFPYVHEIWLIARDGEKLESIADKLTHCHVRTISCDLCEENDRIAIGQFLKKHKPKVSHLIQCAGFGLVGDFTDIPAEEQLNMIELNNKALVHLTHLILPYMKDKGRIIMLASAAAFMPQAGFAVYAASKSFVLSFSRGLNEELRHRKITVTAVCPGPVNTEFFNRAEQYNASISMKKKMMVTKEFVVNKALKASKLRCPYVTPGIVMQLGQMAAKFIPHSICLWAMRKGGLVREKNS
ncbi:MAG: SDR family NAD(P)-dependent oxidoreductase [Lachnospiraceae bacterium]|nr:SDR family NAD(P)-dependent oxidoreductase [Lachnospiraceae bacterium]